MGYYLKLFRLGKVKGVTPEQIMKLVQMADSIHMLDDKLQRLQSEISDISTRKSEGQEDSNKLKRLLDYSFYFSAWSRN
jgi:ppGpp synthetase/RelA/SpoT-type nucleotidyltranferase